MFFKDKSQVYRSGGLASFAWLEHGFGTRHSVDWPDPWRLVMLKQIHSDTVIRVDEARGYVGEGDALETNRPGLLIGVRTADCVPILVADPEHRAVGAIHAGWKGTSAGIAANTVRKLQNEYDSDPAQLYAAIGPAIGGCCYEVGPEVLDRFRDLFPELPGDGKANLDLVEANRRILLAAGLDASHLFAGAPCTKCNSLELHSYRSDGPKAGRMIAAIGVL